MNLPTALMCVATALAALGAAAAVAQVARSSGSDSQRALAQLQQLAKERTALQEENARLKRELEKAKADAASATNAASAARRRLATAETAARSAAADTAAQSELAESKRRLQELVSRYRDLADNLRNVETERATMLETATARSRDYDRCAAANAELYVLTTEVLDRYENAGFGHALGRAEPFTRLTRTRVENLVDEYRARAAELRTDVDQRQGQAKPR
jgi:chromosome segregation ATPase